MTKLTQATLERFGTEPDWRREQRAAALGAFRDLGLPDTESEVWKYAPLGQLHLGDLDLAEAGAATADGEGAIVVADGVPVLDGARWPEGVQVRAGSAPEALGSLVGPDDAFAALNLALHPAALVVEVAPGARLDRALELSVRATNGASFPRLFVHVGRGASARVVEHQSGDGSLSCPVAEFVLDEGAVLEVVSVQSLAPAAWSIARTRASLGRDADFRQVVVGLGGRYDRVRADARLAGDGASSTLHTAHVGTDDQVHDLRTMQVHEGARTTSRLYSKAAVAGHAESIYSGLISMRPGARRADARQANQSLVLSEGARADAVPNLDIQENDVRCSHASSVGPVDEEQRWYLESRGVEPGDAVNLIVEGFFAEVAAMLDGGRTAGELRSAIGRLEAGMGPMGGRP